jgi:hypothetical protein
VDEKTRKELEFVLDALYTVEAEIEQLEISEDWFVSDSRDKLASAKQILQDQLGIEEYDYDEEPKQHTLELRFD